MIDASDSSARRDDDAGVETDSSASAAEARSRDECEARIDSLMRALTDTDNARKRAERHAAEAGQSLRLAFVQLRNSENPGRFHPYKFSSRVTDENNIALMPFLGYR